MNGMVPSSSDLDLKVARYERLGCCPGAVTWQMGGARKKRGLATHSDYLHGGGDVNQMLTRVG